MGAPRWRTRRISIAPDTPRQWLLYLHRGKFLAIRRVASLVGEALLPSGPGVPPGTRFVDEPAFTHPTG
jgi:hypothetical protein